MVIRIVRSCWFPPHYHGVVLWPFMFLRPYDEEIRNEWLFRHELEHVYQIHRLGVVKFYATYLWLLVRHGYSKHPYEIEARKAVYHKIPLTTVERHWYETGRIGA